MDKYAAEKVASDYYNLGVQHAMEKLANPMLINAAKMTARMAKDVARRPGGAAALAGDIAGQLRTAGRVQSRVPFTGGARARRMLEGAGLSRVRENPIYAQNVNRMGISNLAGESRAAPGLMGARPGEVMTLPKARLEYNASQRDILGNRLAPTTEEVLYKNQDLSRTVMGTGEIRPGLAGELSRLPSEGQLLADTTMRLGPESFAPRARLTRSGNLNPEYFTRNRFDYRPTRNEALDRLVKPYYPNILTRKDIMNR